MSAIPLPPSLSNPYFERGFHQQQQVPEEMYYDFVGNLRDTANHLLLGMTRVGKGVAGSGFIEAAYEAGYKVVVIYCPKSLEQMFKRYPADGSYGRLIRRRGDTQQGYKVEAYFPMCDGYTPEEVPNFFHPYTIPVVDSAVTAELLSVVNLVGLTPIGTDAINDLLRDLPKKADVVDLYLAVDDLLRKGYKKRGLEFELAKKETAPSIHRIIYSFVRHLLATAATHRLAMTSEKFVKMLNRQKEISVFTQAFLPDTQGAIGLQPFYSLFPLELVFQNAQRCNHPILVCGTEVQDIMLSDEVTKSRNPAMKLFSLRVTNLMKRGGKYGIRTLLDTQNWSDMPPKFVSNAKLLIFHYEIEDEKAYRAFGRRKRWMKLEDLNNELLFLKHNSRRGEFEFFDFDSQRRFQVRLMKTAHPNELNKSDFFAYVRKVEPKREWVELAPIYAELDALVVNAAEAMKDVITTKKDAAAEEMKRRMDEEGEMELGADGVVSEKDMYESVLKGV